MSDLQLWMKLAARLVQPSPKHDLRTHDPNMMYFADEGGGRWLRMPLPPPPNNAKVSEGESE